MTAEIRRWKDLADWLPSGGDGSDIAANFEAVPLGEFLQRVVRPIDKDRLPLESLNVVEKITFGGVLHVRTSEKKVGYKGPLFRAEPGELVFSKIRIGQGSLCVVPPTLDHLAVSPEYPVYRADSAQVRAHFLDLLLRSPNFQKLLRSASSGNTTKKRIGTEFFEEVSVPLPDTDEQDRLLAIHEKAARSARILDAEADRTIQHGIKEFEASLGLVPPPDLPRRFLQIGRFKNLDRWSHEAILHHALVGNDPPETHFEIVSLEEIADVSYGIQKCPSNRPGLHPRPYLRVANVRRGRLDLKEIKYINVSDAEMKRLRLEPFDILFVEGNGSKAELGRAAMWNGEIDDCVHQNHIIKARPDRRRIDPEFLMEWFNTDAGRQHFFRNSKTTSGLGTLNSTDIRTAPVPLPPTVQEQQKIVQQLRTARREAEIIRQDAGRIRTQALSDFLNAVFH